MYDKWDSILLMVWNVRSVDTVQMLYMISITAD